MCPLFAACRSIFAMITAPSSSRGRSASSWPAPAGRRRTLNGTPWRNGCGERFNSRLRDEVLNAALFESTNEAQSLAADGQKAYNHDRPHSSLGYQPPAQCAAGCAAFCSCCVCVLAVQRGPRSISQSLHHTLLPIGAKTEGDPALLANNLRFLVNILRLYTT